MPTPAYLLYVSSDWAQQVLVFKGATPDVARVISHSRLNGDNFAGSTSSFSIHNLQGDLHMNADRTRAFRTRLGSLDSLQPFNTYRRTTERFWFGTYDSVDTNNDLTTTTGGRQAVFHEADQQVICNYIGTNFGVWDVNSDNTFTRNATASSFFNSNQPYDNFNSLSNIRALLLSPDGNYLFSAGTGGANRLYVWRRSAKNTWIAATISGTIGNASGPMFYDHINEELHFERSGVDIIGRLRRTGTDTWTIVDGLETTNGLYAAAGAAQKVNSGANLKAGYVSPDGTLLVMAWRVTNGWQQFHLFKRDGSNNWIQQAYPFSDHAQLVSQNAAAMSIIAWPGSGEYIALVTNGSGQKAWYQRSGDTYVSISTPFLCGGRQPIVTTSTSFAGLREHRWYTLTGDAYDSVAAYIQSSLAPIRHIDIDAEGTALDTDIGSSRLGYAGTRLISYTRNVSTDYDHAGAVTGSYAMKLSGSTSRSQCETNSTTNQLTGLSGLNSGTAILVFKTPASWASQQVNPTNSITEMAFCYSSTSTTNARLLFGFHVDDPPTRVYFACKYADGGTSAAFCYTRICTSHPLELDTWYTATVYQPNDGTDVDIHINGEAATYIIEGTLGAAGRDGWFGTVYADSSSGNLGIGRFSNTETSTWAVDFYVDTFAILGDQLTPAEQTALVNTAMGITNLPSAEMTFGLGRAMGI